MNELATIRRAYRYVVAYERRMLDAFARIDEAVRDAGFVRDTPYRWRPMYRSFPSRDWPADRWAWDHVPLYAARLVWIAGEKNTAGSRYVLVDHVADTAFEAKRLQDRSEPEPLDGLAAPEDARTILRWHVVELAAPVPDALWNMDWHGLLAKHFGVPVSALLPVNETPEPVRRDQGAVRLTSWCLDLATVDDPAALGARFVEPLRAAIERAGKEAASSKE